MGPQQTLNTSLDDHERRISHSLYGGLEGLDDNLMPRQGMMPRTIGKTDTALIIIKLSFTVTVIKHSDQLHCKSSE